MTNKIKVGLIGVGTHSTENLIPALRLNTQCLITAVYSSDAVKVELLKSLYNIPNGFNSWKELILDSAIDCVIICGSPEFHQDVLMFCIEKNKPFFVEKPPLKNLQSFDKLEDRQLPVNFVGYNYRYSPLYTKTVQALEAQAELKYLKIRYTSSKPIKPFWDHDSVLRSYLYAVGIHPIELLLNKMGEYTQITLNYQPLNDTLFVLDIFVRFVNGKSGILELGNYTNKLEFKIEIINSNGKIARFTNLSKVTIQEYSDFKFHKKEFTEFELSGSEGGYVRTGYQVEIDEFISAVQSKLPATSSDIKNSKEVYRLMEEVISQITTSNF